MREVSRVIFLGVLGDGRLRRVGLLLLQGGVLMRHALLVSMLTSRIRSRLNRPKL